MDIADISDISVVIDQLSKSFADVVAVDNISFQANRGEVLGFLGPNGAGKSTTMKMITGFLTPTSGTIQVGGIDMAKAPKAAKQLLGYLPEGAPAYEDMTVKAFLQFIAEIRGFRGQERNHRIAAVADQVDLHQVLLQPIATLSKGYKRRVGLAQAIIHDPQILILDEPTDGLDPNQKHEVRGLIKQMAEHKVIILSTHILEEVDAVCNRAIIIANGKIVADGTPRELEAKAMVNNAITVSLAVPHLAMAKEQLAALPGLQHMEILHEHNNSIKLKMLPTGELPLVPEINRVSREQDWLLEQMMIESGRLEDYFREITRSGE